MKTLQFQKDDKKKRVTVACADGNISVYSHCAYCRHCRGVWVGTRITQTPQAKALTELRRGTAADENLMNAAMMFNTLIRDGNAIACDDEANEGFSGMY